MEATERPLGGRRVVVTRASEQAVALAQELESLGAEVVSLPTIAFREPQDTAPLDRAIGELGGFDWLLFTSQNAARFFARRCRTLGAQTAWPGLRVAAVGPATAQAAREEGFRVDYVAKRYRGGALAEELRSELAGKKVLLPRSDRAGDGLPAALRAGGAEVAEVVAYRTVSPQHEDQRALAAVLQRVDAITFASPSAFHHFAELAGQDAVKELSERAALAAIGPTTAQAIREAGLPVAVEAAESTSAGLAAALVKYFTRKTTSGAVQR